MTQFDEMFTHSVGGGQEEVGDDAHHFFLFDVLVLGEILEDARVSALFGERAGGSGGGDELHVFFHVAAC